MERLRRRAPIVLLAVLGASGHAIAGDPKPPPLPPGCERWTDGRDAALSLDDKRLAFVRWEADPNEQDYHGKPVQRPRVFVRVLATKKDTPVPKSLGCPVAWTAAGGLGLSSGEVVDPATGKRVAGTAVMPKGPAAVAMAWTRDGRRLAFAADWTASSEPVEGVPQVLVVVDADRSPRPLDFGNKVYSAEAGALSWSPDGKRVAFNMAFFVNGQVPPRRVGVVSVDAPTQKIVCEMPLDNGIPGLHDERRSMRPAPGTAGPRIGAAVWDAAGARFAYVSGGGDGNDDVYLSDAEGTKIWRQTTDGETKWSPALDPSGRRVAFLTGRVVSWPVRIEGRRVRVLDVVTGDAAEFKLPGSSGLPGNLAWTSDGSRVFYEIHGGDVEGVYAQSIPAPKPAPPGATVRNLEVSRQDDFAAALRSGQPRRIESACENADADWDDSRLAVLREVFPKWIDAESSDPARAILRLLAAHGAGVAEADVRKALRSKDDLVVKEAVAVLEAWRTTDAIPDLEGIRTKHRSGEVRFCAAVAMVVLGDERGWPDLEKGAKASEPMVRSHVCRCLAAIGGTRSVEMLLPLVADDGFLYTTIAGDQCVGDDAVLALARLTGKFFRRESAKWTAWWKDEAHTTLPEKVDPADALKSYEAWMAEREAEHQRKMREK